MFTVCIGNDTLKYFFYPHYLLAKFFYMYPPIEVHNIVTMFYLLIYFLTMSPTYGVTWDSECMCRDERPTTIQYRKQ